MQVETSQIKLAPTTSCCCPPPTHAADRLGGLSQGLTAPSLCPGRALAVSLVGTGDEQRATPGSMSAGGLPSHQPTDRGRGSRLKLPLRPRQRPAQRARGQLPPQPEDEASLSCGQYCSYLVSPPINASIFTSRGWTPAGQTTRVPLGGHAGGVLTYGTGVEVREPSLSLPLLFSGPVTLDSQRFRCVPPITPKLSRFSLALNTESDNEPQPLRAGRMPS